MKHKPDPDRARLLAHKWGYDENHHMMCATCYNQIDDCTGTWLNRPEIECACVCQNPKTNCPICEQTEFNCACDESDDESGEDAVSWCTSCSEDFENVGRCTIDPSSGLCNECCGCYVCVGCGICSTGFIEDTDTRLCESEEFCPDCCTCEEECDEHIFEQIDLDYAEVVDGDEFQVEATIFCTTCNKHIHVLIREDLTSYDACDDY